MTEVKDDWITNAAGNRASIEYFGSEEAARASLETLEDCQNCTNCSRCSDCSGCSGCSRCSRCSDCSGCSRAAFLYNKQDVAAVPSESGEPPGAPLVPRIPNIHQTVYEAASHPKALDMATWHTCEKTHCRAGWVVTLAGEQGRKLEAFHNTCLAAQLIYAASGYDINPGRFFDDNAAALADMKKLAESA